MKIKLGSKVKDTISGFEGTVVSRVEYLEGCDRYEVLPEVDKDGKYMSSHYFDEGRLEVAGKAKPAAVKKTGKPGGHRGDPPPRN